MNTEERQLAEMLHRVTPEPPRGVTVEDVAFRLASQPGREPRSHRGFSLRSVFRGGHGWTPVLAALSVFAIAGASAGIATVATSHHGRGGAPSDGTPPATASVSSSPPASPSQSATSAGQPLRVAGGMWDAELINRQSFNQGSLASSGDALYAVGDGSLARIDLATGAIRRTTPYSPPLLSRPVIVGNTAWAVSSYSGGNIVLRGYDTSTLARVATVSVPAIGGVSVDAAGVLAAGPDGKLYVAAGDTVATVDPAAGQVTHRILLTAGRASSVAVSPDGSKLYVGVAPSGSFRLLTYDLATGRVAASSRMSASGGNLLATAGGVWGTTGSGMSEWVWFAPGGDLAKSFRVSQGAGGGLVSLPTYSGGVVWVGGTRELVCASPVTGHALARTSIPADHNSAEYFDSPVVLSSGHTYALYQDEAAQLAGVASLTPPAACSG
jgi:outer membrane protein assembly factor BamB